MFILSIFFYGCEDSKDENSDELDLGLISITTGNVNVSDFYFNLINGEEVQSSEIWSVAVKTEGDYDMPSIFFEDNLNVAIYDNIIFDNIETLPTTFTDHLETNHSVFRYQGSYEILGYNMQIHKVGVTNPNYTYVIQHSELNKAFKVQFVEYLSGITVFNYSEI